MSSLLEGFMSLCPNYGRGFPVLFCFIYYWRLFQMSSVLVRYRELVSQLRAVIPSFIYLLTTVSNVVCVHRELLSQLLAVIPNYIYFWREMRRQVYPPWTSQNIDDCFKCRLCRYFLWWFLNSQPPALIPIYILFGQKWRSRLFFRLSKY